MKHPTQTFPMKDRELRSHITQLVKDGTMGVQFTPYVGVRNTPMLEVTATLENGHKRTTFVRGVIETHVQLQELDRTIKYLNRNLN